jgi:hypothetical protein
VPLKRHHNCNKTEVASNKSSSLLKIILQDTQTLQLLPLNLKHKLFTLVSKNAKLEGLGKDCIQRGGGSQVFKVRAHNCFD